MPKLSAIGRSRAIPRAMQAVSDLETAEVGRQVAKEDLGIRQAAETRTQTKFTRETKQFERQEEMLNSEMNLFTHPTYLAMSPEGQAKAGQYFASENAIDIETGIGVTRNINDTLTKFLSTKEVFTNIMGGEVEAKKNNFLALDKQVRELQATDPQSPKLEKLVQQRDIANTAYRQAEPGYLKHVKDLEIEEAKTLAKVPTGFTTEQKRRADDLNKQYTLRKERLEDMIEAGTLDEEVEFPKALASLNTWYDGQREKIMKGKSKFNVLSVE